MTFDLLTLLGRFKNVNDFESQSAIFRTNIPFIAPLAYLHKVFKPIADDVQKQMVEEFSIPDSLARFYRHYNGANLFLSTISIFGMRPKGSLLNRNDWKNLPPFPITEPNRQHAEQLQNQNLLCFASYGYDRSLVCMEKSSQKILCFQGENFSVTRQEWENLGDWVVNEISRISEQFDELGHCKVEEVLLLPSAKETRH